MVFQNVYLFDDTIENNIKFGKPEATHEEVIEAAKKACCDDFISTLPDGYNTVIGEGGASLSGGEKQKIACASVTMPDPDVMVLDEPTSNLDCRSIQILADIIAVWKNNGKTVIIAEHRLNYLKAVADRVIYMEDGKIVEDVPAKRFWNLPVEVIKQRGLRSIVPVTFERMPPMYQGNGILEMKNFRFSYNGILDLDISSLSIPTGAVVGIIGNNGSGKTTFARCLCGLERKAAGEIRIEGEVINCKKRLKNSYLVMQDVNHQLFTEGVEEVLIGMPGSKEKIGQKPITS